MYQLTGTKKIIIFLLTYYLPHYITFATSLCNLNPYYVPLCGSDGRTYGNINMLHCHNNQRSSQRKVRVMMRRDCQGLICPNYEILQGPWKGEVSVCANNGYTYGHVHQVRCLKDFIPTIEVLHEGGCSLNETRRLLGRNYQQKACHESRKMFEKNIICGSNKRNYANPFRALCTNPRLHEKLGGRCGCPFQISCEMAHHMTKSLKRGTRTERERYVVCGSDRRTYRTQHHLECSRRYNKYLYKVSNGACKKTNPCPEKLKYIKVPTPVCGSDNRSYISYEALLCAAARMHRNLKYLHSGPCVRRT